MRMRSLFILLPIVAAFNPTTLRFNPTTIRLIPLPRHRFAPSRFLCGPQASAWLATSYKGYDTVPTPKAQKKKGAAAPAKWTKRSTALGLLAPVVFAAVVMLEITFSRLLPFIRFVNTSPAVWAVWWAPVATIIAAPTLKEGLALFGDWVSVKLVKLVAAVESLGVAIGGWPAAIAAAVTAAIDRVIEALLAAVESIGTAVGSTGEDALKAVRSLGGEVEAFTAWRDAREADATKRAEAAKARAKAKAEADARRRPPRRRERRSSAELRPRSGRRRSSRRRRRRPRASSPPTRPPRASEEAEEARRQRRVWPVPKNGEWTLTDFFLASAFATRDLAGFVAMDTIETVKKRRENSGGSGNMDEFNNQAGLVSERTVEKVAKAYEKKKRARSISSAWSKRTIELDNEDEDA